METPNCIGFIMDGNRRWAKENGVRVLDGHKKGFETFKNIIDAAKEFGVQNLIFYAFSTENWNRTEVEVASLLSIFSEGFGDLDVVHKNKVQIRFIGDLSRFSKDLQGKMKKLEAETKTYDNGVVLVCVSYGGRAEIVQAANKAVEKGEKVSEESFKELLWTASFPDPDIIVRTGEEMRLSNFLPWQSVYSELYFTDTYWPDFGKDDLEHVIEEYGNRERRNGK